MPAINDVKLKPKRVFKIDKGKALILREKGLSYSQIGKQFGTNGASVHKAVKPILDILESPDRLKTYRDKQIDVIDSLGMRFLSFAADDKAIKKSSTLQLVSSYGILFDKKRLLENKSLNNIDLFVESADSKKLRDEQDRLSLELKTLKETAQELSSKQLAVSDNNSTDVDKSDK